MKKTINQRLMQQITLLDQLVASQPERHCRLARFDRQLFSSKGTQLHDYLDEIKRNAERLTQMCQQNSQRTAWLAQRLANQVDALCRETLTQPLRTYRETRPADALQITLERHREYARRLHDMIAHREQQLGSVATLAEQQQLKRELDALAGRSERCHQALRELEWQWFNRRASGNKNEG